MGLNSKLFVIFFKIGISTIGGGYAMIPMMEREIVEREQWLTKEEFVDILSVAQITPGIFAVDLSSHIGYKLGGLWSAIVAALANILPSFLIILLIAYGAAAVEDNIWVEYAFKAIRPAVVALIVAPVFSLAKSADLSRSTLWIPVLAVALICIFKISAVWVILSAGVLGGGYGYWKAKQVRSFEKNK